MNFKLFIVAVLGLIFGAAGLGAVEDVYLNFTALVVATTLFSEWVLSLTTFKKFWAQLITWGTGIVLTGVGWLLALGFLIDLIWWQALVTAIGVSLAANGVWDTGKIKLILEWIGALTPKPKE